MQDHQCIWANDLDPVACRVYRRLYGDLHIVEGDIRNINAESIPEHDILTAGFPCVAFSTVGKQLGFDDERGMLFFEAVRIIRAKMPRIVVLENVRNLVHHNRGRTFYMVLKTMNDAGYRVDFALLKSSDFGVPQKRVRIYIVGIRDDIRLPRRNRSCEASCLSALRYKYRNELRWTYFFRYERPVACNLNCVRPVLS